MHHAHILMEQDMTVKHEGTRDRGITEIKTTLDAVVGMPRPFPEWDLIGVAKILIFDRLSVHFQKHEMDLVYVEVVGLQRPVFDGPVFHRST